MGIRDATYASYIKHVLQLIVLQGFAFCVVVNGRASCLHSRIFRRPTWRTLPFRSKQSRWFYWFLRQMRHPTDSFRDIIQVIHKIVEWLNIVVHKGGVFGWLPHNRQTDTGDINVTFY